MYRRVMYVSIGLVALGLALPAESAWEGDDITGTVSNIQYSWPSADAVVSFTEPEFVQDWNGIIAIADFSANTLTLQYRNDTLSDYNTTWAALIYTFESLDLDGGSITGLSESSSNFTLPISTTFTDNSISLDVGLQNSNPGDSFTAVFDISTSPEAIEYTVEFTGMVRIVGHNLGDEVLPNDPVEGCFTYAASVSDSNPEETIGQYLGAVKRFHIAIGDAVWVAGGTGIIDVWNNAHQGYDGFFASQDTSRGYPPPEQLLNGEILQQYQVAVAGNPGDDILSSDSVPTGEELGAFTYFTASNDINWMRFSNSTGTPDDSTIRWTPDDFRVVDTTCQTSPPPPPPPPPQTPSEEIQGLMSGIESLNLKSGTSNSLLSKLRAALNVLNDEAGNNDKAAVKLLRAFINSIEAQRGKKISVEEADNLVAAAEKIISDI